MAMQIDRALTHVPPSSERVVTEHQQCSINREFRVCLNTLPAGTFGDGRIVIVTCDKMLAPVQHFQQACYPLCWLTNGEIAQVPNFVLWFDYCVPPISRLHPLKAAL